MSTAKRKVLQDTLQQRVRARREPSEEPDYIDNSDDVSAKQKMTGDDEDAESSEGEEETDKDSDKEEISVSQSTITLSHSY